MDDGAKQLSRKAEDMTAKAHEHNYSTDHLSAAKTHRLARDTWSKIVELEDNDTSRGGVAHHAYMEALHTYFYAKLVNTHGAWEHAVSVLTEAESVQIDLDHVERLWRWAIESAREHGRQLERAGL